MTTDPLLALADRAVGFVKNDSVVGLGAGRAAVAFVRTLAERVRAGLSVRGVPASEGTASLARELGIPLVGLDSEIDITVDGADEVDPSLDLIKGWGGALVRERIVACASCRKIIVVERDKLVDALGMRGRLPVEVVPFALPLTQRQLEVLNLNPSLRLQEHRPFVTDNGNVILDCAVTPIPDPRALYRAIRAIPGVVDAGLFLGIADTVLVADGTRVSELHRKR